MLLHCYLSALTHFFRLWHTSSTILYSPLPSRLNSRLLWRFFFFFKSANETHPWSQPVSKQPSCLESPLSLQAAETSYFTTNRTCEQEQPHTHFSVRLPFRPQHGDSASPCVSWPSPIRWHWQCFCSDIIRPLSCIWRNRPPHYSGSCPKLLWNFWSCYRLVSVTPFRPSAKLIISVDDVSSDQAVLQFGIPEFSPVAHFVRFVYSTTCSNISTYLGRSVEKRKQKRKKETTTKKQVIKFWVIIFKTKNL